MQDRHLYEQILGIQSPWHVERVDLKLEDREVHVHLSHREDATWHCSECGRECPLHEHTPSRAWRHLDTCQYRTLLHAATPRTACPEHGVHAGKSKGSGLIIWQFKGRRRENDRATTATSAELESLVLAGAQGQRTKSQVAQFFRDRAREAPVGTAPPGEPPRWALAVRLA